ncbi:uncharacterized protein CcaverHIS019_0302000 [Cutaneotrichosporon cavernicola]|uniref:Uncharacterized protein n=1 Tax=Cutaneotrichosporon cavernicola TaxID=279322 RepID=A0AA48I971_9TREE|nr:uncharacterized protein CcaverHIS019_0302000 [Cutaneotrichosporon cavernicola]BEI90130.1 hypothetical protein CcaverHIS019_0302000 [Cutaneotrichosporon cavernicola]BEI97909.1 hypothetical protein CcaverHIS631_0302080 [Cutaneotrichosporon cavernicola]BEJ05687.1 hypothetical protein CcaverHIS641_0302090 [Cutaneotrichosporon cavernicola]
MVAVRHSCGRATSDNWTGCRSAFDLLWTKYTTWGRVVLWRLSVTNWERRIRDRDNRVRAIYVCTHAFGFGLKFGRVSDVGNNNNNNIVHFVIPLTIVVHSSIHLPNHIPNIHNIFTTIIFPITISLIFTTIYDNIVNTFIIHILSTPLLFNIPNATNSSSSVGAAATGVTLGSNLAVILPSILVPFGVLAAVILLVFCLRKRRKETDAKRAAMYTAYHRTAPQWEPVPTTEPPEKPRGPSGGTAVAANIGAGAAAVTGAHALAAGARGGDDSSSTSSAGDERSSLLHRGSVGGSVRGSMRQSAGSGAASYAGSSSGLAGVGTAMGAAAVAVGGLGLLRSLGLGKRPRTESPTDVDEQEQEQDEAARKVSGNTMERMIGLVRPNRGSKRSSGTSGQRSGSGGTNNTSADPKRSSGGTSTGAYVPVPEDELFYAPRPIMDRSIDSDEMYHSARSRNSSSDYDPGTVGTRGSNSSRSSGGHSGRSHGSKSNSSKSSRGFRGAGGRVHSMILEEGVPPTAAFAGGDLGLPETPTSASFSIYDSAGSGSGSKDGQDLGEFGTRGSARGSRLALPPGSAAGRYSERNSSVGTFGTPFDPDSQSRGSTELLTTGNRNWISDPALVGAGAAVGVTAAAAAGGARRRSVDSRGRSPFASPESTRSGHGMAPNDSVDTTPRLPQGPVGMVPLNVPRSTEPRPLPLPPGAARAVHPGAHQRSGSQEMMAAAAAALAEYQRSGAHQRTASHQFYDRTPSPVKHSRSASTSHALLAPMPGLNRSAPGPIIRPMPLAASAAVGGDMMLSPFGPPPRSQGSGSNSHPSTGPSLPSASAQGFVFPAPPDIKPEAQRSTESLAEPRHSGTTASADGSQRRGSAPRSATYDEFGVQQGTASRSEPILILLNSPDMSLSDDRLERRTNRESSSSDAGSGWDEVGTVQRLGQEWNSGLGRGRLSGYSQMGEVAEEAEPSPFDPVEAVTPERARRGEFGSPVKLLQRLWR